MPPLPGVVFQTIKCCTIIMSPLPGVVFQTIKCCTIIMSPLPGVYFFDINRKNAWALHTKVTRKTSCKMEEKGERSKEFKFLAKFYNIPRFIFLFPTSYFPLRQSCSRFPRFKKFARIHKNKTHHSCRKKCFNG